MKTKIAKNTILILALIGLLWCSQGRAQIILQDGSVSTIANNTNVTSISQSFTVTPGADALVVQLYDQNNIASDSGPTSLAWGAQPLVKAGGEYDPRGIYSTQLPARISLLPRILRQGQ